MAEFRKLRLVHVTDGRSRAESLHGGDVSIYHFTRSLAALGHDVRFVGVTQKEASPIPGVDVVSADPAFFSLIASGDFERKMIEYQPDLIHFHGSYVPVNSAGARVARKAGIPYVLTPHGNLSQAVLNRRAYLKKPYRAFFELPMLEQALFVHAIADREVIREYGVTRPIEEARNGIDLPSHYKQAADRIGVTRHGVSADRKVALFLGRLDQGQKGLDLLIEGFAIALTKNPELHLLIAGVGWKNDQHELEELVARLGLKDSVTFTGAIYGKEKEELLRDCDCFVHPSRWEAGVPFSVLEALAYGKPCVVTAEVDREGILQDAPCIQLVEIDAGEIAQGLTTLINGDANKIEISAQAARTLCKEHFSWRASAQTITAAYLKHLNHGFGR